jgi:hypothetical protein
MARFTVPISRHHPLYLDCHRIISVPSLSAQTPKPQPRPSRQNASVASMSTTDCNSCACVRRSFLLREVDSFRNRDTAKEGTLERLFQTDVLIDHFVHAIRAAVAALSPALNYNHFSGNGLWRKKNSSLRGNLPPDFVSIRQRCSRSRSLPSEAREIHATRALPPACPIRQMDAKLTGTEDFS